MKPKYLLDNMVFSESMGTNQVPGFYHERICPGFWKFLNNESLSTIRFIIQNESNLSIKEICPNLVILNEEKHIETFGNLVNQINDCNKYTQSSIYKFMKGADPWLIAVAKDLNLTLVTQESYKKYNHNQMEIKIPNVCEDFEVNCWRLQDMLIKEKIQFNL